MHLTCPLVVTRSSRPCQTLGMHELKSLHLHSFLHKPCLPTTPITKWTATHLSQSQRRQPTHSPSIKAPWPATTSTFGFIFHSPLTPPPYLHPHNSLLPLSHEIAAAPCSHGRPWPWKLLQDEAPSSLKLSLTMRASLSLSSLLTLDESSSLSPFFSHKIGS